MDGTQLSTASNMGIYRRKGGKKGVQAGSLHEVTMRRGTGYLLKQTASGAMLRVPKSRGGSSAAPYAFQPTVIFNDPIYVITFAPGAIGGLMATNWNGEFTLSGTPVYFKAVVSATDGAITSWSWEVNTTPAPAITKQADSPPSPFRIAMGAITGPNSPARMTYMRSFDCVPLEVYRVAEAPVIIGAEPFTRHFTWKVNQSENNFFGE